MGRTGKIVILNGASSAGKTTVAHRFVEDRAAAGEIWIEVALDDYIAKLPWQWIDGAGGHGPYGRSGLRFEPSREGVVPVVGEVGRRLLGVFRRAVAAWARDGFSVLADEVIFDRQAASDWHRALAGLDVTWVGLRCHPDVAEQRERSRGDRHPGLARGLSAVVHEHVSYDLELDSTRTDPDRLVGELNAYLAGRTLIAGQ